MRKEETEELRFSAQASKPMKRNRNNSVLFFSFIIGRSMFDVGRSSLFAP